MNGPSVTRIMKHLGYEGHPPQAGARGPENAP